MRAHTVASLTLVALYSSFAIAGPIDALRGLGSQANQRQGTGYQGEVDGAVQLPAAPKPTSTVSSTASLTGGASPVKSVVVLPPAVNGTIPGQNGTAPGQNITARAPYYNPRLARRLQEQPRFPELNTTSSASPVLPTGILPPPGAVPSGVFPPPGATGSGTAVPSPTVPAGVFPPTGAVGTGTAASAPSTATASGRALPRHD
ncbi:hypothetical protein B0O99DRAFT_692947 [Bisporella sp. PMI_857]|nr:hypothetical protein B0O99DRAFT_692947 [Bisporella sp. PMI_857]